MPDSYLDWFYGDCKYDNHLPRTDKEQIAQLKALLDIVGEWIAAAEVKNEPGWEGSRQDILDRIAEALND